MAEPSPPNVRMRTDENMHARRELLRKYRDRRDIVGASVRAKKLGRHQGVPMGFLSPWSNRDRRIARANDWVFGPDPVLDNVYQCMPQVNINICATFNKHVCNIKQTFNNTFYIIKFTLCHNY